MSEKNTHGGQREGAGPPRKMVEPKRVTITIERKAKDELVKRYKRNWQDVVRTLIDNYLQATPSPRRDTAGGGEQGA